MKKAKMLLNRVGGSDVIATSGEPFDHTKVTHFHVNTVNSLTNDNKEGGYWFIYDSENDRWTGTGQGDAEYVEISNAKFDYWYYKDDNGNWVECEESHPK